MQPIVPPPTRDQLAALRALMQLLVEEDVAAGVSERQWLHCDGCQDTRPLAGAVTYDVHWFCNACATEYEVARLWRRVTSVSDFIRGKQVDQVRHSAGRDG